MTDEQQTPDPKTSTLHDIVLEFVQSNTFLNCGFIAASTFAQAIPQEWLANHAGWRTWLPPTTAAMTAAYVKINQLIAERKQ